MFYFTCDRSFSQCKHFSLKVTKNAHQLTALLNLMYGVSGFFGGFCGLAGVFMAGWFAVELLLVSEECSGSDWTLQTSAWLSVLNDAPLMFCT